MHCGFKEAIRNVHDQKWSFVINKRNYGIIALMINIYFLFTLRASLRNFRCPTMFNVPVNLRAPQHLLIQFIHLMNELFRITDLDLFLICYIYFLKLGNLLPYFPNYS